MKILSLLSWFFTLISQKMLRSWSRRAHKTLVKTIDPSSSASTTRTVRTTGYALHERYNSFSTYKQIMRDFSRHQVPLRVVQEKLLVALAVAFCATLLCTWVSNRNLCTRKPNNPDTVTSSACIKTKTHLLRSRWDKYSRRLTFLTARFQPQVSNAPTVPSGEIEWEVAEQGIKDRTREQTAGLCSEIGDRCDDNFEFDTANTRLPDTQSLGTIHCSEPDERTEPYFDLMISFLKVFSSLKGEKLTVLSNRLLQTILDGKDAKTAIGILSLLCKLEYIGKETSVHNAVSSLRDSIGSKLPLLFNKAIASWPDHKPILQLTVNYVLFSRDAEVDTRILGEYFRLMIFTAFSEPAPNPRVAVLRFMGELICSLGVTTYEETYLPICEQYFSSNRRDIKASFEMVRIMRVCIVHHKSRFLAELAGSPHACKADSMAYKTLRAFRLILASVVLDCKQRNTYCVLLEANKIYMLACDLLLNRQEIPFPVQIDIITEFISPIYKTLNENSEIGSYDTLPPSIHDIRLQGSLVR